MTLEQLSGEESPEVDTAASDSAAQNGDGAHGKSEIPEASNGT